MSSTLPTNFEQLQSWMANFLTVLEAHVADFDMVATDLDVAKNYNIAFSTAQNDYASKYSALASASAQRKDTHGLLTACILPLIRRVNNHPNMSNSLRAELGLKPRNLVQAIVPITELKPEVSLEAADGAVIVHWGPNPGNERINGKPAGVKAAHIYRRKNGEETYQPVGYATTSPYVDVITGPAADYTYIVRYRGTKATDLSLQSAAETIAARGEPAA